jgi:hypothetical protein
MKSKRRRRSLTQIEEGLADGIEVRYPSDSQSATEETDHQLT